MTRLAEERCFSIIPCEKKSCCLCWPKSRIEKSKAEALARAEAAIVRAADRYINSSGGKLIAYMSKHTALARAVARWRRAKGMR